jgi:lipopolysaccharide export system permease protein
MLFHSTLRKELARSFGGSFVVLITVVMTMMLIRTLGQASKGSVDPQDILLVMGYTVVGHLPTILTLSLFVCIVGTFSRIYRDSEMVIWFTSGQGLGGFVSPVFRFAWPVLLLISVLALLVWPWTSEQTQMLRDRYENRGDLERIAPGQFQESSNGRRVFFVEKDTAKDKTGKNVFILSTDRNRESVTSARMGRVETIDDNRYLVLSTGQRLESRTDNQDVKLSEFSDYGIRIGSNQLLDTPTLAHKSTNSLSLVLDGSPFAMAELTWRIGLALSTLNLCLLAIAITSANPRVGKSHHLLLALFTFVVYYNFINLSRGWVSGGHASLLGVTLSLHGSIFLLAVFWLGMRHRQWSWRDLLRFKTSPAVPA